jgi:ribosome biogenesis GTPase / thiamine phosphate phosphatase
VTRARVYKSAKRVFDCKILNSGEIVSAKALGNLLKNRQSIVVGDYVTLEKSPDSEDFHIVSREDRSNEIFRMLVRENKKKVTVSNCDIVVIQTSVSRPEYKRGLIDRYLARAIQWNITPIVVFNKMDQFDESLFDLKFEAKRFESLGVRNFEISAVDPKYSNQFLTDGFEELNNFLKDKTSIFLGQSGVGKSKTISALSGGEIELKTSALGKKSGKGSHTTTWTEIVECRDFILIDSPGIRSFGMDDIAPNELISYFPDIESLALQCKFNDCTHLKNAKGCVFWNNANFDTEDALSIIHSRLESYQKIHTEISQIPEWQKERKAKRESLK